MRCVTSRSPPNLGKIATSLCTIIGGISQTFTLSNLGLGRRLERALVVVESGFEFVLRYSNVFFVSMACGGNYCFVN